MDAKNIVEKVKEHIPNVLGNDRYSKYAVLIPLVEKDGELHILFEIRSYELKRQPGDICFPGGRVDASDQTSKEAAIRETREELGISENDITTIYPLDYVVSPFGMLIYSFVGFIKSPDSIHINPSEVEDIFTVPLTFFLENKPKVYHVDYNIKPDENFPIDLIVGGENYDWKVRKMEEQFYLYDDKVIWGLTAKILSHFIDILHNSK
ncbi:NUDIX hydrolase [Bacillus pinisoli]|uniref:NUDIX hydrolase n=1 Tax=Bacillus pinisoli TaxID=2901866 RepID=UPI001FF6B431|nr:CoA pyrophosphatase [Bacillus pinisoli]